ncbi:MAG: cellulase family glycosylhydrolase [Mycobacterium sp.]
MRHSRRFLGIPLVVVAVIMVIAVGVAAAQLWIGVRVGPVARFITDTAGRVVIYHGLNQVFKEPPYQPSGGGFDNDDAAFLRANGFNAVRLGVIWAAVEPQPGIYDEAYLDSIAKTVQMLGDHGIGSLLDFHQDLYNEKFQGEGAPLWAVQDGGRPNPELGFPANYFRNPALQHAFDQFWLNSPGPDGVGLQEHFAAAWTYTAARFAGNPNIIGYDLLNEPWPGTQYISCAVPLVGCSAFERRLTEFYEKVATAIRTVDPTTMIWFQPNLLFNPSNIIHLGTLSDARSGFSFHVYCPTEVELHTDVGCRWLDDLTFAAARGYAAPRNLPEFVTEFGSTDDIAYLSQMVARGNKSMINWTEWAYTGTDKTSTSSGGQALVYDPASPPMGLNVNTPKLKVLAVPYPQLISGTPTSWEFADGTFRLSYSTMRADTAGTFGPGAETVIAVPAIQFPNGYTVQCAGARVTSAPNAPIVRVASLPDASTVAVTVTPNP